MAPLLNIAPKKIPVILELCAAVDRLQNANDDKAMTVLKATAMKVLAGISEIVESQQGNSADEEFSKAGERFDNNVKLAEMQERVLGRVQQIEEKVKQAKQELRKLDVDGAEEKLREVGEIVSRGVKRRREE
jgi:septation ring formation regulator EzrA